MAMGGRPILIHKAKSKPRIVKMTALAALHSHKGEPSRRKPGEEAWEGNPGGSGF